MRITSKGQVIIPAPIRELAGLLPDTDVEFVVRHGQVVLQKPVTQGWRGKRVVEALRGKGAVRMTTDQIMALTRGE